LAGTVCRLQGTGFLKQTDVFNFHDGRYTGPDNTTKFGKYYGAISIS